MAASHVMTWQARFVALADDDVYISFDHFAADLRIVRLARVSPAILKMMRTMLFASPLFIAVTRCIIAVTPPLG